MRWPAGEHLWSGRAAATAYAESAGQRDQREQPPVFLVRPVVDRLPVRLHPFSPGDQHRPAFPWCRAAPDSVAVPDLERPGQARTLHGAGSAERYRALRRLVRSREERFRVDAAAGATRAPCFVGASFLDCCEQSWVASSDGNFVRTRHTSPCHQPTSPVGPVLRVVTRPHHAVRHHSGAGFYRTVGDQNKGLIYLETKLAFEKAYIYRQKPPAIMQLSEKLGVHRRLQQMRPVVAHVAHRGADRSHLDRRELTLRHRP